MIFTIFATGQSNTIGSARTKADGPQNTHPNVKVWNNVNTGQQNDGDAFVLSELGANPYQTAPSLIDGNPQGNFVHYLGIRIAQKHPDLQVRIINVARGSTPASWWTDGGHMSERCLRILNAASPDGGVNCVLVNQGEANHSNANDTAWRSAWAEFQGTLDATQQVEASTKYFFVPPLKNGTLSNRYGGVAQHCTNAPRRVFVPTHGLAGSEDNIHFTGLNHWHVSFRLMGALEASGALDGF